MLGCTFWNHHQEVLGPMGKDIQFFEQATSGHNSQSCSSNLDCNQTFLVVAFASSFQQQDCSSCHWACPAGWRECRSFDISGQRSLGRVTSPGSFPLSSPWRHFGLPKASDTQVCGKSRTWSLSSRRSTRRNSHILWLSHIPVGLHKHWPGSHLTRSCPLGWRSYSWRTPSSSQCRGQSHKDVSVNTLPLRSRCLVSIRCPATKVENSVKDTVGTFSMWSGNKI